MPAILPYILAPPWCGACRLYITTCAVIWAVGRCAVRLAALAPYCYNRIMPMPDSPGPDDRSTLSPSPALSAGEEVPPAESALRPVPPDQRAASVSDEGTAPEVDEDDPLQGRHVHQIVSVRLGATADSIFVSRTETIVEHTHGTLEDEHGDLSG